MEFSSKSRKNSARWDKTEVIGYMVTHREKSRKGEWEQGIGNYMAVDESCHDGL